MNAGRSRPEPASQAGAELDALLERWARQQRLSPARAAAIHDAIIATPSGLPAGWLQAFQAHLSAVVRQATASAAIPLAATLATDRAARLAQSLAG